MKEEIITKGISQNKKGLLEVKDMRKSFKKSI